MGRKLVLFREGMPEKMGEIQAENELELQKLIMEDPDLLPLEEFGFDPPAMVVGRETRLKYGAADLVLLTRGGRLLVVEFKIGKANPDFRHALAQVLDYGAQLARMTAAEFESAVATDYFKGSHCPLGSPVKGMDSIADAAVAQWPGISPDETSTLVSNLAASLQRGDFHFVLVSQDFREGMGDTIAYLNSAMIRARFYAVELVKFNGENLSAFETRTVWMPAIAGVRSGQDRVDEETFLAGVEDPSYRESLREFLEFCRGLGLKLAWGDKGTSIRIKTIDQAEPVSIGWLFPTQGSYWGGLSGLSLGYDTYSGNPQRTPNALPVLEAYVKSLETLAGLVPHLTKTLIAYRIPATVLPERLTSVKEAIGKLTESISEE